ncbi:carbohydrate ABC transporter permease [Agrobacterium vitis]|uniref:Maltose/maltodextrin transport system permease protein MalG n=1 Tax=Agrobacterium vitis TaxID=373 RepID=A0A368P0Z7_AGRVI|nr:carbohydrate ABC transporter permease [Agrobacterium vitis]KAA3507416.1 carbohydrate ABC transporter permease [Agrobacterium vitis]KAA3521081.1 carbohydrate ABC transporter permease [Agrobacterium vitis]MCF1480099.1 carbohydrate ABC transporter permease [Agrobacterium vitis]MUZ96858.1 carbohydrate ABC transporter permease [Agrobacterium vitis]MVA31872.1 carbohydrate ABC transporter permease [Agrobacterium vitis]
MSLVQTDTMPSTDWARLERRGVAHRAGFLSALILFLTIVSIPILLPYLWLLVKSLTSSDGAVSRLVLWHSTAIAGVGYLGAIGLALLADRLRRPAVSWAVLAMVIVILSAIFLVSHLSFDNYRFLWNPDIAKIGTNRMDLMPSIWSALGTSLVFAISQTAIVTLVATPAAYALSRFAFAGRENILRGLLLLHAFPALALTVAIFIQLYYMGLLNNLVGVVLVLSALELPFAIFVLKGFFDGVPWDIEMSAVTDGATRFQAFRMVILPQIRSGLIAVATFTFLRGWEEYVFVQTLLIEKNQMTMSLYLFFVAQDHMGADYGMIAAVGIVYLLPVLILYIFTQKYITQMSFGGIKG